MTTAKEYYGVHRYFFCLIGEERPVWQSLPKERTDFWEEVARTTNETQSLIDQIAQRFHVYQKELDYQGQAISESNAPREVVLDFRTRSNNFWNADQKFDETFFPQQ